MNQKSKTLFAFLSLLLVVNLACASLGATPTATPTPLPTNTPPPTATPITLFVDGSANEALDENIFTHKTDAFEFNPPKGWTLDEYDYEVFLQSPESVFFYVSVTNTGNELRADEFSTYIQNVEDFFYSYREGYQEINREANPSINLEVIEKTYPTDGGGTFFVRSLYQQFGQSIFSVEMSGDYNEILSNPSYDQIFAAFFQSLTVDSGVAATLPVYGPSWIYQTGDQAYNINIPYGWKYNYYDVTIGFTEQYQIASPDGNAAIQSFENTDSTLKTDLKSLEEFSLILINGNYTNGANDIEVVDRSQESGRVLYEWKTDTNQFTGYAYVFEKTSSAEAWLFIIFWENAYDNIYRQPALDILSSLIIN
jgi:hypothetical protein